MQFPCACDLLGFKLHFLQPRVGRPGWRADSSPSEQRRRIVSQCEYIVQRCGGNRKTVSGSVLVVTAEENCSATCKLCTLPRLQGHSQKRVHASKQIGGRGKKFLANAQEMSALSTNLDLLRAFFFINNITIRTLAARRRFFSSSTVRT